MSFTGIGRIGSQHILNINIQSDTDNFGFPSGGGWWCTHPLKYSVDILDGDQPDMTAGSKIVTAQGTALFTNLCSDFQLNSTPIYKYIAVQAKGSGNVMILEVDYVIDDNNIALKFPATETDQIIIGVPIDYFNTMILKEVTIISNLSDDNTGVSLEIGSKFGESSIYVSGSRIHNIANEGGVEPILITANTEANVILNY